MKRIMLLLLILTVIGVASLSAKAFMGVFTSNMDKDDYEENGIDAQYGIRIDEVIDDTPADKAGFEDGDILLTMDGDKIYTGDQLTKMLSIHKPGKKVKCRIMREKKEKTLTLEIGNRSDYTPKKPFIGINMVNLKASTLEKKGVTEGYGILLTHIIDDTAADEAGLEDDDILLKIDDDKIYTIDQLGKIVDKMKVGQKTKFLIFRDGERKTYTITVGEKELGFSRKNFWFGNMPNNIKIIRDMDKHPNAVGFTLKTVKTDNEGKKSVAVTISKITDDSPAEEAGLKEDDEILTIDGKKVSDTDDIFDIIDDKKPGDTIEVKVMRDGKEMMFKPVLKKREDVYDEDIQIYFDKGAITMTRNGETIDLDEDVYIKTMQGIEGLKGLKGLKNLKNLENLEKLEELEDLDIDFDFDFEYVDSGEI